MSEDRNFDRVRIYIFKWWYTIPTHRGIGLIEALHQMLCLVRFKSDLSAVQVRNERAIPGLRQPVRHTLDLVVQTPPFLDHHDTGRFAALFRFSTVTGTLLSIRPFEINIGSHVFLLSEGLEELVPDAIS